jgi:hypothetical protein
MEVLGSGAPSADAGEVMVVVQEHGILSVPEVKRPWVTPKGYLVGLILFTPSHVDCA